MILCTSPLRVVFVVALCSFIVFLGVFFIGFQSQVFWRFISPMQDLGGWGALMWSLNLSLLREMIHIFVIPPVGGLLSLEFFPGEHMSFCLWVWKLCSPTFQVYFHGKFSTYSFSFVVFVGGSKFRIFLYHHLELSPWCFPFLLLIFLLWFTWLHFPCDGSNDRGELWISSSPKSKLIRNSLYNLQRKILMMILICLVCLTFPLLCPLFHFLEWNVVL